MENVLNGLCSEVRNIGSYRIYGEMGILGLILNLLINVNKNFLFTEFNFKWQTRMVFLAINRIGFIFNVSQK